MSPAGTGRCFRRLVLVPGLLLVAVFLGLGVWQVQRLAWKTALIARVEAGLAADPVAAPGPADWPALRADSDEYRRISVTGRYLPGADVLVQAVTQRGPGFWVMTPFETQAGWRLLVNRGFVPADRRAAEDRPLPGGDRTVAGLLRMSQPGGGFLRRNDPAGGRWFSRDTAAIGATLRLGLAAPYFLDAERAGDGLPLGGLTVVSFRNSHLSYALTWFALAGGLAVLLVRVRRAPERDR
ncbi:SURF1 family protein [Ensifer soli]|uniref:SURF1 family protein n=1 Tax=Ciceribacter sp. sgz301302 TaxID=3342379 RepID=UPI0035B9EADF